MNVAGILRCYLTASSVLMIIFVVASWLGISGPGNHFWLHPAVGYVFFFCLYNIPVCGGSGLYLIFSKGSKWLGSLCLIASIAFYLWFRQIGDAF